MSYGSYHMTHMGKDHIIRKDEELFPLFSENKITLRRKEYIMTAIIPAKIGEMNQDDTK